VCVCVWKSRLINFPKLLVRFRRRSTLTINVQRDPLADGRRHVVGRYAQIMSHLTAVHIAERQRFSLHFVHCLT